MNMSSERKALKIVSIVEIAGSILLCLIPVFLMFGLAGWLYATEGPAADVAGTASGLGGFLGEHVVQTILICSIPGILALVTGILSWRAAANPVRVMPAFVMSIVMLVLCAVPSVLLFATGEFFPLFAVIAVLVVVFHAAAVYFVNNVRKEQETPARA